MKAKYKFKYLYSNPTRSSPRLPELVKIQVIPLYFYDTNKCQLFEEIHPAPRPARRRRSPCLLSQAVRLALFVIFHEEQQLFRILSACETYNSAETLRLSFLPDVKQLRRDRRGRGTEVLASLHPFHKYRGTLTLFTHPHIHDPFEHQLSFTLRKQIPIHFNHFNSRRYFNTLRFYVVGKLIGIQQFLYLLLITTRSLQREIGVPHKIPKEVIYHNQLIWQSAG